MFGETDKIDPSDPNVDFFAIVRRAQAREKRAHDLKAERKAEKEKRSLKRKKRNRQ